jgi:hypothetical protein
MEFNGDLMVIQWCFFMGMVRFFSNRAGNGKSTNSMDINGGFWLGKSLS